MFIGLPVKYPLLFSDINEKWFFCTDFLNTLQYHISRKSVQREPSCSMRTDGRIDRHDENNNCFSQFCESA